MAKSPPKTVALNHDDMLAEYIGRLADGRQFYLTTPSVESEYLFDTSKAFIALYIFDKAGELQSATIEYLGPKETLDETVRAARRDALLASLGPFKYQRIKVAPFRIEMFEVEFGFIPLAPKEPGDEWAVIVRPDENICFWPPWTSGKYA